MNMSGKPRRAFLVWLRPGELFMLLFRALILFFLLMAGVSFAFYAATGQPRYKRIGWVVLKWTILAAFGFFAVLIAERVL